MTLTPLTPLQKSEFNRAVILHGAMSNKAEWTDLVRRTSDPDFDSQSERDWVLIEGALRNRLAYDDYVHRDPAWYADVLAAIDYATRRAYLIESPQYAVAEGACDETI